MPSSPPRGSRPTLTGAVLVGGASRRFAVAGRSADKLAARLGDAAVVDHAVAAVRAITDVVLLVGAAGVASDADRLPDARPAGVDDGVPCGPLAGIVAALEAASTELVVVVAGDMPLADARVLRDLATAWDRRSAGVVPVVDGGPEPLHAVYAAAWAPAYRDRFDAGERSPLAVARALGAQFIPLASAGSSGPMWTRDVDTPGDLDAVAELLGDAGHVAAEPCTDR